MENKKKKSKAKIIIIVLVILGLVLAGFYYFTSQKGDEEASVYVMPVSQIVGNDLGVVNKFSGIVEAQQTVDYKLDSTKVLKTTYVEEGDEVKVGDKLFSYDVNSIKLEIEQLNIDIQKLNSTIESNNKQIEELEEEKKNANDDQQLEYSLNIQQLKNENSSTSYSIKTKQNELTSKKASLSDTDVLSTIDGIVKSITPTGETYISLMSDEAFVVKSTINEMNIYQMSEGTLVNVYSRIDDSVWTGTVSKIDTSKAVSDNNSYYYESNSEDSSSKYYFYVELDDCTGLFLGQHVIVQANDTSSKEGLWLNEYYLCDLDSKPYVFKQSGNKIKKAYVTLGEYDEELCEYQITEGLTLEDAIAYPSEEVYEGAYCTSEYAY